MRNTKKYGDKHYCIFHLPENTANKGISNQQSEDLSNLIDEWIKEEITAPFILPGLQCGGVDFSEYYFVEGLSLNDSSFHGDVMFVNSTFNRPLQLSKAIFNGNVDFRYTTFNGNSTFQGATFNKSASFTETIFRRFLSFDEVLFKGSAMFHKAMFGDYVSFIKTKFNMDGGFKEATFSHNVQSMGSAINGVSDVDFDIILYFNDSALIDFVSIKTTQDCL